MLLFSEGGLFLETGTLTHFNAKATFVQSTKVQTKTCQVGIHWIALAHVLGSQSFFSIFALFRIGQVSHQQHKGYNPTTQTSYDMFKHYF